MELYLVLFSVLLNGLRFLIEADFIARCLRVQHRAVATVAYVVLSSALFALIAESMPLWGQLCLHFATMALLGMALLRGPRAAVLAPCAIVATLFALAEGLSACVANLLPFLGRYAWGWVVFHAFALLVPVLAYAALRKIAARYIAVGDRHGASYLYLLLLPCLLMVLAVYLHWDLWDGVAVVDTDARIDYGRAARDLSLLLCALLSFAAVLVAFFRLMRAAERDVEAAHLEQQMRAQRQYVVEARERNERFRAFHHDVNNHFAVFSGLLASGKEEAAAYLRKIRRGAEEASGTVHTGNVVLDVLLGEKIAHARRQGVEIAWESRLPERLAVDDFDLCILFANALDNAIAACAGIAGAAIRAAARTTRGFLLIEVENPHASQEPIIWGTGLKNMRRTVEKYNGTLRVEQRNGKFVLSLLLCL